MKDGFTKVHFPTFGQPSVGFCLDKDILTASSKSIEDLNTSALGPDTSRPSFCVADAVLKGLLGREVFINKALTFRAAQRLGDTLAVTHLPGIPPEVKFRNVTV
jgi:hypothetical protein